MEVDTIDRMTSPQLVAILLGREHPDKECMYLADRLIFGMDTDIDQSDVVKEDDPIAMTKVQVAIELGRRRLVYQRTHQRPLLSSASDVVELMEPVYLNEEREVFYCLCLDTKNRLKRMGQVSIGNVNSTIVSPREVFRLAVVEASTSIIITHNHPSGDPEPSSSDISLTARLARAGDNLGITLMDHIIIGGGGAYESMREKKVL